MDCLDLMYTITYAVSQDITTYLKCEFKYGILYSPAEDVETPDVRGDTGQNKFVMFTCTSHAIVESHAT